MSMTRETTRDFGDMGDDGPLDHAVQRLDRALAQLETRVGALRGQADAQNSGLFDQDRAKLAEALDAARARERALAEAGSLASQALGRAIAEIRAALGDGERDDAGPHEEEA